VIDFNKKYNDMFEKNKFNFLYICSDVTKQDIESYEFKMNPSPISFDINKLNYFNSIAINRLGANEKTPGLCGFLTTLTLEVFCALLKQNIAYLTVGKIYNSISPNIFFTPDINTVINKMKEDQINKGGSFLGGNIHAWITLDNGLIIDPSISLTIEKKNEVVVGFPNDINNKYIYEPYTVTNIIDYKSMNIPEHLVEYFIPQFIEYKFKEMNIFVENPNGYYK